MRIAYLLGAGGFVGGLLGAAACAVGHSLGFPPAVTLPVAAAAGFGGGIVVGVLVARGQRQ
jgi:ABC-type uncharacterized transport system permease subunit